MMKTMTFHEFKDKWETMPKRPNSYLSLGNIHPLNLQIGRGNDGRSSFVIVDSGSVKNVPSSFAIKAHNPTLANGKMALEFQLVHKSYEEVFQRLCWDMIEATSESACPLEDIIARYITWQKLLQYCQLGIMSFERQKGLLGELLYFRELLQNFDFQYVLNAWCGPDGSDQDFQFAASWSEIKTVALASDSVKISSLEQLNQEQDGNLIIYVLEKTVQGNTEITLPEVVASIRAKILDNSLATDQFEMKLFKYGYRAKDENDYQKNCFRFVEKREYSVCEEFPKLTRKNVPAEITACHYELSLPAIEKYRRA